MTVNHFLRVLLAPGVGSLGAATCVTNALLLMHVISDSFIWAVAWIWAATAVVAYTLGLMWHAVAQAFEWRGRTAYWLPGAIVGALIPLLIGGPSWNTQFEASPNIGQMIALYGCPIGAALGGLTGLFAWLIRRPDRDAPANPASTGA